MFTDSSPTSKQRVGGEVHSGQPRLEMGDFSKKLLNLHCEQIYFKICNKKMYAMRKNSTYCDALRELVVGANKLLSNMEWAFEHPS
jgi:hypothetical protein